MKKRLFGMLAAAALTVTSVPLAAYADEENEDYLIEGQSPDGTYDCKVWNEARLGEISFDGTTVEGGAFSCKWDNTHFPLFTKGHNIKQKEYETYKLLGDIECDYEMDYQASGISKYGVYGWVNDVRDGSSTPRIVEYYIIDGYTEWRPLEDAEPLGTLVDNGCTYDLYATCNTQAEFSTPEYYFYQYYSIIRSDDNPVEDGKAASVSHKIDVDRHFAAWEKAGMSMNGQISNVSFFVESWDSSGEANVKKNVIEINPEPAADMQMLGTTPDESYFYEIWNQMRLGEVAFDGAQKDGGAFSCEWNDTEYSIFSKSSRQYQDQTCKELHNLNCDYEIEFVPQSGSAFFGVHGWFKDCKGDYPAAEYYIIDGFRNWKQPKNAEALGTITADGYTYDLYRTFDAFAPTILGMQPCWRYWSIIRYRNAQPASGVKFRHCISIDEHFKAWEEAGLDMSGQLYDAAFIVETHHGSGAANVIKNIISTTRPAETAEPEEPEFPAETTEPAADYKNPVRENEKQGKTPDGLYDYYVQSFSDNDLKDIAFDGDTVDGGTFFCTWSDTDFSIFYKGHNIQPDCKTYKELGKIDCDYAIDISSEGDTLFGVHGLMLNCKQTKPFVEYYIIEGYNNWTPSGNLVGQITDNGCTYDIYYQESQSALSPCIYRSVISADQNPFKADGSASCKHQISVDKHFAAWEAAGLDMTGEITDVKFCIENTECSGKANVSKNEIIIAADPQNHDTAPSEIEIIGSNFSKGDVNCDFAVDVADAVLLARYAAEDEEAVINATGMQNADCNLDGTCNLEDVTVILKAIARLIVL